MQINKWIPRKLWQQIFLILLCLVIIPLIILGFLLIRTSQKAIEETVSRDLKQIALHATGEVLKEYEGAYRALDATAAILGTLHADSWRQETVLVEISLKHPAFKFIYSSDLNGKIIASSHAGDLNNQTVNMDMLRCVREGQDKCVSDLYTASDHLPVIDIAVPIYHYGKINGAIIAQYSLRGVWEVIDQIQFGPQSQAILVDQQGRILAHLDKKKVLNHNSFVYDQVIKDLQQGKNSSQLLKDNQDKSWIMAYSPISSLRWGLIIAQPYHQAFAFLRVMHFHSWVLIFLSVLAAGLIGFLIAQWMSQPMNELIQATRRLAQGDLSTMLPIHRRDEINRLKFSFNHMLLRLKKARQVEQLSMVGKSAASIAHELKNSLVLIKSFVQLIPLRHREKAFVQEATETITRELDGWNAMLRNMMDFSREQMPLQLVPVNINLLIEEMLLLVKLRAQERQVTFNVHTQEALPLVHADETRFKQVLVNLITNAFDATPFGGEITVQTFSELRGKDLYAGFKVKNTGSIISKENLEKIFDPFFTTKDSGLGLGLAISRDIVKKHDGQLEVESQLGKGTVFSVSLPAKSFLSSLQRGVHDFRENRSHR